MQITRHYLTVNGRRVHYRRCGNGPPLLMIHQSPRSSAEFAQLMQSWGAHFTCIAPDTPGFGQSAPLPIDCPTIDDLADATAQFARAIGLERTAAYGFHSGGIILVTALRRHPTLFHGLAVGGYAVWTEEEMRAFGDHYLPPFHPAAYGEHLIWLWNRILEQSWFFPWFDVRDATRLRLAHDDPDHVHAIVMDMLDAGDAYRAGYGAVLRAPRDIPPASAAVPPVLITAYDGDPLQAHLARLGELPAGWRALAVPSPAAHQAASLDFLASLPGDGCPGLAEDRDAGFVTVRTDKFDGLIHWQKQGSGAIISTHAPGQDLATTTGTGIVIDAPGHGLSSAWQDQTPDTWHPWQGVFDVAADALGAARCTAWPDAPCDPTRYFPDLSPDRFGGHLTRAWGIVRAATLFRPWYESNARHAILVDEEAIAPESLAMAHRALLRAHAARAFASALNQRNNQ